MQAPQDSQLLELWEQGLHRHPIDRAVLLASWARPELPPQDVAGLPLGALNRAVLELRRTCFGSRLEAFADCPECGQRHELVLEVQDLLGKAPSGGKVEPIDVGEYRFRVPDSRDLAAVAFADDAEAAAIQILRRCCLSGVEDPAVLAELLEQVEQAMEAQDPAASFEVELTCQECSSVCLVALRIGDIVWSEIQARARLLLSEVHAISRSYGWTESEILSLTPQRRAAYIELVNG